MNNPLKSISGDTLLSEFELRGLETCSCIAAEKMISNSGRFKQAFAERDTKQTLIDI
jgi:hypothetical protein